MTEILGTDPPRSRSATTDVGTSTSASASAGLGAGAGTNSSASASARTRIDPSTRTLVVGLGSPHGDDQAGWLVVSELAHRLCDKSASLLCRLAKSPCDMLDWFDDATRVIVLDACESAAQLGELRCWHWPAEDIVRTRSSSSHQLGLCEVLELATTLGRLPVQVEIRTIGSGAFMPGTAPSSLVSDACQRLAQQLWEELAHA